MAAGPQLRDAFNLHVREVFDRALKHVDEHVDHNRNPNVVPFDTGRLENWIRTRDYRAKAPIYQVTYESAARSSEGTDYGQILEVASEIAPRRARALRWVASNGDVVFNSRGFTNRHQGWWSKRVWQDGRTWTEALARALNERG